MADDLNVDQIEELEFDSKTWSNEDIDAPSPRNKPANFKPNFKRESWSKKPIKKVINQDSSYKSKANVGIKYGDYDHLDADEIFEEQMETSSDDDWDWGYGWHNDYYSDDASPIRY